MKKILLTIGSIVAVASPIAAVVSCGSNEETNQRETHAQQNGTNETTPHEETQQVVHEQKVQSNVLIGGDTITVSLSASEFPPVLTNTLVKTVINNIRSVDGLDQMRHMVVRLHNTTGSKFYSFKLPLEHATEYVAMVKQAVGATITDTFPVVARDVNAKQNEVAEIQIDGIFDDIGHNLLVDTKVKVHDFMPVVIDGTTYYGQSIEYTMDKARATGIDLGHDKVLGTSFAKGDKFEVIAVPDLAGTNRYAKIAVRLTTTNGVSVVSLDASLYKDSIENLFNEMKPIAPITQRTEWKLNQKDAEASTFTLGSCFDALDASNHPLFDERDVSLDVHGSNIATMDVTEAGKQVTKKGKTLTFTFARARASGLVIKQANGSDATTTIGTGAAIGDKLEIFSSFEPAWNRDGNEMWVTFRPATGSAITVKITDTTLKAAFVNLFVQSNVYIEQTPVPHEVTLNGAQMKEWHLLFYRDGRRSLPWAGTVLKTIISKGGHDYDVSITWGDTWCGGLESDGATERWPAEYVSNHVPDATPGVLLNWLVDKIMDEHADLFKGANPTLTDSDLIEAWGRAPFGAAPANTHHF